MIIARAYGLTVTILLLSSPLKHGYVHISEQTTFLNVTLLVIKGNVKIKASGYRLGF